MVKDNTGKMDDCENCRKHVPGISNFSKIISSIVGKLTIYGIQGYRFEKDSVVTMSFSVLVSFEKQCLFKVGEKKKKRDCIVKIIFSDLDFEVKNNFV